jgi:hypothetical protein
MFSYLHVLQNYKIIKFPVTKYKNTKLQIAKLQVYKLRVHLCKFQVYKIKAFQFKIIIIKLQIHVCKYAKIPKLQIASAFLHIYKFAHAKFACLHTCYQPMTKFASLQVSKFAKLKNLQITN